MAAAAESETYVCDSCDAERTGTIDALEKLGWVRHSERGVFFLMCKACEEYFQPIWARRRAKRDAEREARQ